VTRVRSIHELDLHRNKLILVLYLINCF
jgi:hypothetical protein